MSGRILRRRMPAEEYLIGYAEDDEPVENIMKKFKQLEEYQERLGRTDLTPEDCRELINNTSIGDIRSSFRPRYDISEASSSSDDVEDHISRPAPYMDPITQSYKCVRQPVEGGQILETDIFNLILSGPYQAILVNAPSNLQLKFKKRLKYLKGLVQNGLVFLWSNKQEIKEWVELMEKFKFQYVENMVWVKVDHPSVEAAGGLASLNDFTVDLLQRESHSPFTTSHKTLLIFRKIPSSRLELRHQRTCDVVFDYEEPKNYVYHLIETLLPEAGTKLELWGDRIPRDGWLHVCPPEDNQQLC